MDARVFFLFYTLWNRRESDYVTFYSSYNPNNESYILAPPAIYYAW